MGRSTDKILVGTLTAIVLIVGLLPSSTIAQEYVSILHRTPYTGDTLPSPGVKLSIKAQLSGTKETSNHMRMILVKDGELVEVPYNRVYLNKYDDPEYEFLVNAPIAEIAYSFILGKKDGQPVVSTQYRVRRPCLPKITLVNAEQQPKQQGEGRLHQLVGQANALEREVKTLDEAIQLIGEIQAELENIKQGGKS